MSDELIQPAAKHIPLDDGVYIVDKWTVCAGFIVQNGALGRIAPVLRNRFKFWLRYARRIGDV